MSDLRSLSKLCGEVIGRTKPLQRRGDASYLTGKGLFDEFMEAVKLANGQNEDAAVRPHLPPHWEANARDFLATHEIFAAGK